MEDAGAGGSLLPLGLASRFSVVSKRSQTLFSLHCSIFRRTKSYFRPLSNVFMALSEPTAASWSRGN